MKNQLGTFVLGGILAAGLTVGSAAVFAQQDSPAPDASAQQAAPGRRQPPSPDEQVARMTRRYSLSADQQAQIKPILVDQQQKMMALHQDSSMSRDDKMAKMKDIHEDSSTKIQAILNDSQKQKFAQDQQRMQERMAQRSGGTPPSQ